MSVYKDTIQVETKADLTTYVDITEQVKKAVKDSGIKDGICSVITSHTTCSVFYEEYAHDEDENGFDTLQQELNRVLAKIIPDHDSADTYVYPGEEHYREVESWDNAEDYLPNGDRSALWNGDAHLRSTIIGTSQNFNVENGELVVGSTGYVYFADFDRTRARQRKCSITVLGE